MRRETAVCLTVGFLALVLWNWRGESPRAQTPQATSSPQATPTPSAFPSPEATPTPSAFPSPEATPTPTPSAIPTPEATPTPTPTPVQSPTPDFQQHSAFDPTAKWPTSSIYVCWENPLPEYSDQMALVQKSIAESWEAASAVRFTGWQRCAPINMGIRILINDAGPRTLGLGVYLDGVVNGMSLNFTFDNWGQPCRETLSQCIKSIAVHEFGHALGFIHEHNRPDTPGECDKPAQGTSKAMVLLTPYDPESVMNYCNPKYNNLGVLSKYDTDAVQKQYGRSPSPTGVK